MTTWPGPRQLHPWRSRRCVAYSLSSIVPGRQRGSDRPAGTKRAGLGMSTPGEADAATSASAHDPLPEALALARGAAEAGLGLKLLGGLAVRVLCPDFPPRLRARPGHRLRLPVQGAQGGRRPPGDQRLRAGPRFNNLNGDRQMYFTAPSGRPDRRHGRPAGHVPHARLPAVVRAGCRYTVDAVDVLLSKLQIVELNEKDARDIVHLLSGAAARAGSEPAVASTPAGSARCSAPTGAGGGRSPATWPSCPR